MDDVAKLKRQRSWLLITSGIAIAAVMGLLRLTPAGAPLPAGLYLMYWLAAVSLVGAAIFIAYAQAIGMAARLHHLEETSAQPSTNEGLAGGLDGPTETVASADYLGAEVESAHTCAIERIAELDRIASFKSNLVYNISHELRTSLASLKSATQMLLEEEELEPGSEYYDRLLQSISRNVARQESLVSNIMDMATIENASLTLHLERVDAGELIAEVTSLVAPLVGQRRQALSVSVPPGLPGLVADRQRLSQVLVNLLSNAQKYSPEGSEIALDVQRLSGSACLTPSTGCRARVTQAYRAAASALP
jgi:signal transduction histidine kinase